MEVDWDKAALSKKFAVDEYASVSFDGDRIWELKTIRFKGEPFAIIECAGESGRDFRKQFLSDKKVFSRAVQYLADFIIYPDFDNERDFNVVKPEKRIAELGNFYGHKLSYFYDPGLAPKYKKGILFGRGCP